MGSLNVQTALIGAVGGALATAAVNQIEKMTGKALDPKIKAAAVIGVGALIPGIKMIPAGARKSLSVGAQITGAAKLLQSVAPQYFSGIVGWDPLTAQIPTFGSLVPASPSAIAAVDDWDMAPDDPWAEAA